MYQNIKFILLCTIIFIITSGCIFNSNNKKENNDSGYEIEYNLTIITQNIDNYSILISYPESWENFLEDIIIVKGSAFISLNETSFGTALLLKSKGNVELSAKKFFKSKHNDLSLFINENDTKYAMIFCNKREFENITIYFEFLGNSYDKYEFGYGYYFNSSIKNGWQKLEVQEREV